MKLSRFHVRLLVPDTFERNTILASKLVRVLVKHQEYVYRVVLIRFLVKEQLANGLLFACTRIGNPNKISKEHSECADHNGNRNTNHHTSSSSQPASAMSVRTRKVLSPFPQTLTGQG